MVSELDGSGQDGMDYRWFRTPGKAWFRNLGAPGDALLAGFSQLHAGASTSQREFRAGLEAKGKWIMPEENGDG